MLIGADRISAQPIQSPKPAEATPPKAAAAAPLVEPIRYHNPVFTIDSSGVVVVQVRDTDTGEIKQQFPSEKQLKAYRQQAASSPVPAAEEEAPEPSAAAEAAQSVVEPAEPAAQPAEPLASVRLEV